MAKVEGAVICLLIVIMDVVAGILGIEAEIAQNKEKHTRVFIFECKVPSHQAYKLGLAAASLLAVSHAIANLLGGCICICSKEELEKSSSNKQLGSVCLVLSWIVTSVAFALLMSGALANNKSSATCGFGHRHFMSVGGILCFVHGLLNVAYYMSAVATRREEDNLTTRRGGGHQHSQPV